MNSARSAMGQVSGRVYRADTGEPIPKTQVSLLPGDEATTKVADERTVRTGPDGAFTFTDIPGGNYEIETRHNGYSEFNGSLHFGQGNVERTNRRVARLRNSAKFLATRSRPGPTPAAITTWTL